MSGTDETERLIKVVRSAYRNSEPLRIIGSGSKFFLGRPVAGTHLNVAENEGILSYDPSELVLSVCAGTKLREIVKTLGESGQMLGFEPPAFGDDATIGGTIACGLSGPRRPFAGSARDFVLGIKCITGKGELLSFGGQVIKNVAGYDVSRLMVGALGTLGILSEISMKVLPMHEVEKTLIHETGEQSALQDMTRWTRRSLPISAMSHVDGKLRIRLSGTVNGTRIAETLIGGDLDPDGETYWAHLKEHKLEFFDRSDSLWRLSLPAVAKSVSLKGDCLIDWAGALRWMYSNESPQTIFDYARSIGGHATMFRPDSQWSSNFFSELSEPVGRIHRNLKRSFDPRGILNPGILYADL